MSLQKHIQIRLLNLHHRIVPHFFLKSKSKSQSKPNREWETNHEIHVLIGIEGRAVDVVEGGADRGSRGGDGRIRSVEARE